jgi:tetrapyrrole methylase family protein/MazG family protein
MARLVLVSPGAGAPEWLSLEAWRALEGPNVYLAPGDPLAERLVEAGLAAVPLPEAAPEALRAGAGGAGARPAELRLLTHGHEATPPGVAALAERLAALAAEHGEATFVLPPNGEPVVRAVLERAMSGGLDVEVVIGRAPRGHLLLDLVRVMARLRGPGGCPWDAEQTHQTLVRYLVDETYELLEAVENGSADEVAEELGDLLLQVVFHAQMATEGGTFDVDDVADRLVRKLVRRHPHVFGDVSVSGADEVVANWDLIKEHEKTRSSVFEDVPEALPALAYAAKLQRRAGKAGFDWDDVAGPLGKVREELDELAAAPPDGAEDETGDLLLAAVALSRHLDVDPETALRKAARRFRDRLAWVEDQARDQGRALTDLSEDELDRLWEMAKRR